MKRSYLALALLALLATTACSSLIGEAIDSAARQTGRTVGEAAGRMVGQRIVRTYTPRFAGMYSSYMLTYAFTPGGYMVETTAYKPGEWTKWQFVEEGEPTGSWLERAFLKRTDDGREWWRVTMYDADSDDTVILEALFDTDRSTLLRLRSKFPDQEISEMPVEEGTTVYNEPMRLTEESLEGATVETAPVSVPAGKFTARHIRFGDIASGGAVEWWLVEEVPGGYVKYGIRATQEQEDVEGLDSYNFSLELLEKGTGATTKLNSYK